jgi:hypothetical protein
MNYNTQKESNLHFIETFKQTILDKNINSFDLIEKFNEYEKHDIDDTKTTELIKIMINNPYYKDLQEVNVLVKFRILQENLKIINSKINDINITKRLDDLLKE